MHFRTTLAQVSILSMIGLTSCGVLGDKNAQVADSTVGKGCLNDSKDLVSRYMNGEIDQTQWKSSFDCVNESLDFFTQYVRGTNPDSYTQGDMYTLVSKFLLTNKTVNRSLMSGAFSLKSALFGGDSVQFKKDEVELLKRSLVRLREITGDLIPYLQLRRQSNPRLEDVLQMTAAFKRAGEQLADFVSTLPTGFLTEASLTTLITELSNTLDIPLIEGLGDKVFLAKWLIFNTRRDAVDPTDWPQFFKTAMGLGGILLAYKTAIGPINPNDPDSENRGMTRIQEDYRFREFVWELALQVRPFIDDSLARHGGITPFPLFDHVIDALPDDMLDNVPKKILIKTLRPIFRKLLRSQSQEGVDKQLIDTVYNLGNDVVKNLGLVDRFYEKTGLDLYSVPGAQMAATIDQFAGSLTTTDDQQRFALVKQAIMGYKPLFYRDSGQIRYARNMGYSRYQAHLTVALEPVVKHLIKAYGSGSTYFIESDFKAFFEDYTDILFALKIVDQTIPNYASKRFQDIDLFTPASDGNLQVNVKEIVNYAMMIFSSGKLTDKMRDEITRDCKSNDGEDVFGWTWVDSKCFRTHFHDRLPYWLGDNFPLLKEYWTTKLSPDDQKKAMSWLENGARRYGYGDKYPIGKSDFGAFAAVLHYTESMFTRFDQNQDGLLYKDEILNAYPIFRNLIAKKAAVVSGNDYILKGVFTFIVNYRLMPDTNNFSDLFKLGVWLVKYSFTNYTSDRMGVFNIVCQLSVPEQFNDPKDAAAFNRTVCAP